MSLMSTSSDEQPTQELDLSGVASRLAFNRQLSIDEIDTELHPVVIEHVKRTIQSGPVATPEQQETLPLISLLSTVIQPAIKRKAAEQKTSSHGAFLSDK